VSRGYLGLSINSFMAIYIVFVKWEGLQNYFEIKQSLNFSSDKKRRQ